MNRFAKYFLIALTLFLVHCSENSLFDQKINPDQFNSVRGKVLLSEENNQDSIYVWMDGLNLSTYTDSSGAFTIELPPAELQPGGGLNGVFKLYYFIANYRIHYSILFLINGKVELNKGDIDSRGNIFPEVWLTKLIDIRTETIPTNIETNYTGDVITKIHLTNMVDTVWVNTFMFPWGEPGVLVIERNNEGSNEVAMIKSSNANWDTQVITEPITWQIINKFAPGFFDPAIYYFYPFLEVVQEDIPPELLASLGEDVYNFSMEYLNIPYKQSPGIFTVYDDAISKQPNHLNPGPTVTIFNNRSTLVNNSLFQEFLY